MLGGNLNKDDINLLSAAMKNPSDSNIQTLLMSTSSFPKIGLQNDDFLLTPTNLQKHLTNKESPLFKYFNNIIMSFAAKKQEDEKLSLLQTLETHKQQLIAEEAWLEEKELQSTEKQERLTSEQQQNIIDTQNRIQQLELEISLNKNKAKELNHWLPIFSSNLTDLENARALIENRYEKIQHNLTKFDNLLSDENTNKEELKEYRDTYQRHIDLSTVENLEKNVPEYFNKDIDPKSALQTLRRAGVHEELFEKHMDQIATITSRNSQENKAATPYQQFSLGLNTAVEKFFNRHEIENPDVPFNLSEPFRQVTALMNSINSRKNNSNKVDDAQIDNQIKATLKALNTDPDYREITSYLQNWQHQQKAEVKENSDVVPRPRWTKYSFPLTVNVNPSSKGNYLTVLRNVFGDKHLQETMSGYKFTKNGCQIYFNLLKNEITLNSFDLKSFEQMAKVVAQTAPAGTISSIDLSRVHEKNQIMAAKIAQEQGLEVVGLSEEKQEKLNAQNANFPKGF